MAEVKLMRNGVYTSDNKRGGAICVVRDGVFKGSGPSNTSSALWTTLSKSPWFRVDQVIWTEDTLVLPEEYLT